MTEPKRLSRASNDELERLLLRAGRPRAPRKARQRAITAASQALAASALATHGSAAAATMAKTGVSVAVKWAVVLGLGGAASLGAVVAIHPILPSMSPASPPIETAPPRATPQARVATPFPTEPSAAPEPLRPAPPPARALSVATEPSAASPLPPVPPHAPPLVRAPASIASSVQAELTTLERARRALSGGDPAQALSILDAYLAQFPRPNLLPEATVLRIDALVRAGDRSAARRAASAFLDESPRGPYAARIRSLVGTANP
ncbi:MAG: hypothetical protein FWD17_07200 [Polyangiaceae bacterium]|nr:hypothetical protein [Polyangiaceae bacterium]